MATEVARCERDGWRILALLLLALLVLSPIPSAARAADESELVARYLDGGGVAPGWARSDAVMAAIGAEARAQGLDSFLAATSSGDHTEAAALSAALRLAHALAAGALSPQAVQDDWTIAAPSFDARAALARLVSLEDPLPWLRSLAPVAPDYAGLQRALERYRALAESGGWPTVPEGPALKPGMSDGRVPLLRRRLAAEAYLPPEEPDSSVYDAPLEQAVRAFQRGHGLAEDGVVGRDTVAELDIDAASRERQIAANLERWRWMPRPLPDTRVMVNAAAAKLTLVERGKEVLALRTVVGDRQHPTPALAAAIQSLLFDPPWDIPSSITRREIRPRLRRDPGYLERERIVSRDDGRRLRQLPGPRNALGLLKFEMPNPQDVYLHDTPSKELFARPQRFFSHGCIRVQRPTELAQHLMQDRPGWSAPAIAAAMAAGVTRRVGLAASMPVYVVYFTAFVEEGAVAFRQDIYGRDAPLIAALDGTGSPPAASNPVGRPAERDRSSAGASGKINCP